MKRRTEKPPSDGMKYFTRDLYLRFNSPDNAIADQADEDSEHAIAEYNKYLEGIRHRLPTEVEKLSNLCLHDANLLAFEEPFEPIAPSNGAWAGETANGDTWVGETSPPPSLPVWTARAVISLRQGEQVTVLIYFLWDRVRHHAFPAKWPFSKEQKHGMYEELDADPGLRGPFMHRILWSDGEVIEIPFAAVSIQQFNVSEQKSTKKSRKPA